MHWCGRDCALFLLQNALMEQIRTFVAKQAMSRIRAFLVLFELRFDPDISDLRRVKPLVVSDYPWSSIILLTTSVWRLWETWYIYWYLDAKNLMTVISETLQGKIPNEKSTWINMAIGQPMGNKYWTKTSSDKSQFFTANKPQGGISLKMAMIAKPRHQRAR